MNQNSTAYINTEEHGIVSFELTSIGNDERHRLLQESLKTIVEKEEGYSIVGIFNFGAYQYFMSQSETEKKIKVVR